MKRLFFLTILILVLASTLIGAQLSAIFEHDIATAAKERLRANRLTAASVQADADFEAQEKPTKP